MLSKILKGFVILFTKPKIIGIILLGKFSFLFPDKPYLQLMYWLNMGKKLDLKNPETFNEKLQWLKLYNHNPAYTVMVDKVKAKEYVAGIIGEEYIIPTLGVWDDPDDIDFDALPDQFVLKCNHNSGTGMCICRDKSKLDIKKVKADLRKGLKENYYMKWREWPYKNVPRKILAEKFMQDMGGQAQSISKAQLEELNDYKIFCFNGEPKVLFVASDRANKVCFDYYDMQLHHLDLKQGGDNYKGEVKLPQHFEEMKSLAAKISKDIPHVRTDFYEINGKVYFGELTFFDSTGMAKFSPEEWDEKLGKLIVLPPPYLGYLIVNENYVLTLHMEAKPSKDLKDYKFFCFNGEPRYCQVISDRNTDEKIDFYDMHWKRLVGLVGLVGLNDKVHNSEYAIPCPESFEEMKQMASLLAKGIPFSRIDFYEINHQAYFGEITFFPATGFGNFNPREWNVKMGDMITL